MFLLFIFSLVLLCDPLLPRISGGLATSGLSQVAPLLNKNISYYFHYNKPATISISTLYQNEFTNGTHRSLESSATSAYNQLPPVKDDRSHKNLYLSPVDLKARTQVHTRYNQSSELEPKTLTDANDDQAPFQNSYTFTENERTTEVMETDFPLLKLNKEYTPDEIAEYIFVTEDEKGFVQGVAEMIEDGQIMSSIDDLILYLEAVQEKLEKLRQTQGNI